MASQAGETPGRCIDDITTKLSALPEKSTLDTLDGQHVALEPFFALCRDKWPACVLYRKFYYWKSEVLEVTSDTSTGERPHRVHVYYNLMSTCMPEKVDPGRTHGDVAEFYDTNGDFMGLAVYMGQGMYVSLPHAGYHAPGGLKQGI